MKCIAVTTALSKGQLSEADLMVQDLAALRLEEPNNVLTLGIRRSTDA